MNIYEIIFIALGLAMDAFAVSVCKGLSMKNLVLKKATVIALYFGFFQAMMPIIGYFLGSTFSAPVEKADHWIAFILLAVIGINMIKNSKSTEQENVNDKIDIKTMVILAIATSIDALAIGVTFAFFKINILLAVTTIGIITFILSILGVVIGKKFGSKIQNKAEVTGGILLIIMGVKILLEHLGIFSY